MVAFPELSLSVVLPVYNEAELVEPAVRRAVASLERLLDDFEILLIDDASRDRTAAVVDALAAELPPVRAIHNASNLKQGGSLGVGFGLATKELVMHNAIDEPFAFDDLARILGYFPEVDVVVITRRSYPGVSAGRRFISRAHRTLLRILFGLPISDFNFVQIYKRTALMHAESFSTATAFITVERVVRAHHAGRRVVAVDADYHRRPSGVSSSGRLRVVLGALADMARLWTELRLRGRGPRGEGAPP